jgi:hypothetical protein
MKIRNDLLSLIGLFVAISIVSCKKDSDVFNNNPWDVSQVPALSADFMVDGIYFNEDSVLKLNFETESKEGVKINGSLFNNFGVGIDTISGAYKVGIFKPQISLAPIIKCKLNECFVKKVIISWDVQKNNQIVDSITSKILGTNASVKSFSNYDFSDMIYIYVDFILINKFGNIEIDDQNPNFNDFLQYKSSNYGGIESDEITLTPLQFKEIYGDKYTSSLTLGTSLHYRMRIANIDTLGGKEKEILDETIAIIKKVMTENEGWDELIKINKFLKNSYILGDAGSGIPNLDFRWSIDEIDKKFNECDSIYKTAYFGVLSKGFEPFSKLYPKYKFLR